MEDELHDLKAAITILKDRAASALGGTKTHTIYDISQEFIDFHLGELEEGMKLAKAEFIKLGDAMPRQSAMEFSHAPLAKAGGLSLAPEGGDFGVHDDDPSASRTCREVRRRSAMFREALRSE